MRLHSRNLSSAVSVEHARSITINHLMSPPNLKYETRSYSTVGTIQGDTITVSRVKSLTLCENKRTAGQTKYALYVALANEMFWLP